VRNDSVRSLHGDCVLSTVWKSTRWREQPVVVSDALITRAAGGCHARSGEDGDRSPAQPVVLPRCRGVKEQRARGLAQLDQRGQSAVTRSSTSGRTSVVAAYAARIVRRVRLNTVLRVRLS